MTARSAFPEYGDLIRGTILVEDPPNIDKLYFWSLQRFKTGIVQFYRDERTGKQQYLKFVFYRGGTEWRTIPEKPRKLFEDWL